MGWLGILVLAPGARATQRGIVGLIAFASGQVGS